MLTAEDRKTIYDSIRDIPDFPQEGIVFKDITTLLNNPEAYQVLMNHLETRYKDMKLDYIAGIDSRGFIFGAALADRLKSRFVPIRKKGKLPYTTIAEKYALEYGVDEIEIHIDAFSEVENARVLIIDDLIATGGTAAAAASLVTKAGAVCVETCFVINLTFLKGADKLKGLSPVYSVLEID